MSKKSNSPPVPDDELPEIQAFTEPIRVPGGWVACRVTLQGRRVLDEEAICDVGTRTYVIERLKIELATLMARIRRS